MLLQVVLGLVLCVVASLGAPAVIDLTHKVNARTLFWPGQPPFNFSILHRGYKKEWDTWLEVNSFALAEHGGTHIDAPSHYIQGHWRTHEIPASHLVGPGVIVDVTRKVEAAGSDYEVTVDDMKEWEEMYGEIPDGAVVIMKTGWSRYYPDSYRVFNSRTPQDMYSFHYPGLHVDTARWLAEEKSVVAVGSDTPSPEPGINAGKFPVHKILLEKNIILLEYVANLDKMPPTGSTIFIGVINLQDGSGGPARIMGVLGGGSAGLARGASIILCLLSVLLTLMFVGNWQ
ncbi:hypothetical protein BaRGS_00012055 [Batillaria attramentaria]|uniref:Cyclase n=1 Tax=Batillaria attramentaria TaxID=370345 RepID=A0ABD0LBL0_9CAEN